MIFVGSPVRVTALFTNIAQAPADPTTTVCEVHAPDGTASTPVVVHDGVGSFHADVTPDQVGKWRYRWTGTGAAAGVNYGYFVVSPSEFDTAPGSIDATVGGASSNSYITVAEADSYALDDLGTEATGWLAATGEEKQKALRRATHEIDGYLATGWAPFSVSQALVFPRSVDFVGSLSVPVATIPGDIKRATYEQATYVLANADVLDASAARRARGIQSGSEPNVSWSEQGTDARAGMSPAAERYLSRFVHSGSSRGIRSIRMSTGYVW